MNPTTPRSSAQHARSIAPLAALALIAAAAALLVVLPVLPTSTANAQTLEDVQFFESRMTVTQRDQDFGYYANKPASSLVPSDTFTFRGASFTFQVIARNPFGGIGLSFTGDASVKEAFNAVRSDLRLVIDDTRLNFGDATVALLSPDYLWPDAGVSAWEEGQQFDVSVVEVVEIDPTLVSNTGQTSSGISLLGAAAPKRAQSFTTGPNAAGYRLASIGIGFDAIDSPSDAASKLTATINADASGIPGAAVCTLTDPASYTANSVNTYAVPETCPVLAAARSYFVVVERVTFAVDVIALNKTASGTEDTAAAGWSIADERLSYFTSWFTTPGGSHLIEVRGSAVAAAEPEVWSGTLTQGFGGGYTAPFSGALEPNFFTHNGVTYTVVHIGVGESGTLQFSITPTPGADEIAAWKFVMPGGVFPLSTATTDSTYDPELIFSWGNSGLDQASLPFSFAVSIRGGTADPPPPDPEVRSGITLNWETVALKEYGSFPSIPVQDGFLIEWSERHPWGNFGSNHKRVGELLKCDIDLAGGARSCLLASSGIGHPESWSWTDETPQRGVSYQYSIRHYHEFYSDDGSTVWKGILSEVVNGEVSEPPERVRIFAPYTSYSRHRIPHPGEPATPTNLRSEAESIGVFSAGISLRLTWDAADNATSYKVFRTGNRGEGPVAGAAITYPGVREGIREPTLTATTWVDDRAERGVRYTYRVAAFNDVGRSAHDAQIKVETPGNTLVPNEVRTLTASATRSSATGASVQLSWTAAPGLYNIPGAQYKVEYRLDVPERAEWEDDWITLKANVPASDTSYTHSVALEPWYARGGSTPPVEYVPTSHKGTLNLDDTDTNNDVILPFGITFEYRVRAFNPESTEGGRRVSVLRRQEGAPVLLG